MYSRLVAGVREDEECIQHNYFYILTGSWKTGLIAQGSRIDFYQNTKQREYTIKFHCQNQPGLNSLLSLAAFPKPSRKLYEWPGA